MKKLKRSSIILAIISLLAISCAIAVFAGCDAKTVTLTFMNDDSVHYRVTGKPGDDVGDLSVPAKTGYEFSGWTLDGNEYVPPATLPEKTTTVYAEFTPVTYTVKFNAGKGMGVEREITATYDEAFTAPDAAKTFSINEAYELTGWASTYDAAAAEYLLDEPIKNLTAQKGGVVTLYAYYTPKPAKDGFYGIGDTLIAYTGDDTVVAVPEEFTTIAEGAFADNMKLKEVVIPATCIEIGFGAFSGCDNLEKITVPFIGGSLTDNTFLAYIFGAASYTDNTFSYRIIVEGAGEIDESTLTGSFYIPRSLRIVVINTPITEIPEGAFYYAYGLEKVIAYKYTDDAAPNADSEYTYRIGTIGVSAFEGCHHIGYDYNAESEYYMQWLVGVETICDKAFKGYTSENDYYTSSLRNIGTLENVVTIGNEAFEFNNGISYVRFGDKLERIGVSAFASVNLLQQVIIPDSCTYIGDNAFNKCIYLSSVTIGKNVEYIGEGAFGASATLTEIFFKGGVPASLAQDAFHGLNVNAPDGTSPFLDDANNGTVFYFENETYKTASESTLIAHCPTAKTAVKGIESAPYYYAGNGFDFWMTFSAGHTMTIHDPYYRTGFGIPEVIGTFDRIVDNVWYNAQIYNFNVLVDNNFIIKLDYNLSSYHTHYYAYKVNTFTMDNVETRNGVTFTIGNKDTDEWYLEENKYGQVGLWHNGEFVNIDESVGATYVVGGIEQMYESNTLRTFVYYQGNKYFEPVITYKFVYVPDENTADGEFTYYGKLYLNNDYEQMLFGYYSTSDDSVKVFVDGQSNKIEITKDDKKLASGKYTVTGDSEFGKHTTHTENDESLGAEVEVKDYFDYTVTFNDGGKDYNLTFTDFLEQVTDGNRQRDIYARIKLNIDGTDYVLYNSKNKTLVNSYFIKPDGTLSDDYYILRQYEQYMLVTLENGEQYDYTIYPGFGEHFYTVRNTDYHDYITYEYVEGENGYKYKFQIEGGEAYEATVTDSFIGTFSAPVPNSGSTVRREYSPFYDIEKDEVFTNGDISIKFSGYGTAVYTDKDGNEIKGKYNVASDNVVAQVYITERQYYNLLEYVFRSDDGEFVQYFVPNLYDSYDGGAKKGDLILPDEMRDKVYRIYDADGYCTGVFGAGGYGMGTLFILKKPDGTKVPIDSYQFAPGATYAYYTKLDEVNGKTRYRMSSGLDMGFFTFMPTDELSKGKNPNDMSTQWARVMNVDAEYDDWWKSAAALTVTAKIDVPDDEQTIMPAREEMGVYSAPNGYTLTLDGEGKAVLKKPNDTVVHEASFVSINAGILGVSEYPFEYTVSGVKYKGTIDIIDAEAPFDNAIIRFTSKVTGVDNYGNDVEEELNSVVFDGVKLNNFAKGNVNNYTGTEGTLSVYPDGRIGLYVAETDTYDYGNYELDNAKKEYTCRMDSKKIIMTLNDAASTYNVVKSFDRINMKVGTYTSTVYYVYDEKEDKYPAADIYGYKVRANSKGNPVKNLDSEYSGTWIDTENGNKYFYQKKVYDLDLVVYDDGEVIATYALLDLINITNYGKYIPEVTEEVDGKVTVKSPACFVIDRGNAIVLYTFGGTSVG